MAWPLRPLGATQIAFAPTGVLFEPLAASILGDSATEKDGFDDVFTPTALSLPPDDDAVTSATPDLVSAGFEPGEFEAKNLLPLAQDTADFTGAGDPLQQSVDSSASAAQPATQTPQGDTVVFGGAGSGGPPGHTHGKGPAPLG